MLEEKNEERTLYFGEQEKDSCYCALGRMVGRGWSVQGTGMEMRDCKDAGAALLLQITQNAKEL